FSSRRRHTRLQGDWSSDVCSSDLLYNRYMSEHSAGQAVADAFTNVEDTMLTLDAGGHLAEFKPEGVKNFPADIQVGNTIRTKLEIGRASCRERVQSSVVEV